MTKERKKERGVLLRAVINFHRKDAMVGAALENFPAQK